MENRVKSKGQSSPPDSYNTNEKRGPITAAIAVRRPSSPLPKSFPFSSLFPDGAHSPSSPICCLPLSRIPSPGWCLLPRLFKVSLRLLLGKCRHKPVADQSLGIDQILKLSMGAPQARKVGHPLMNLVRFKGLSILKQLHLEEQLLRTSSDNWCIINDGTNTPTIVMGLSGKPLELLESEHVLRDEIPVIRRFTGGGTVIVDPGTVFVTLICNKDAVPGVQPYPRSIMQWSSLLYNEVFQGIGDFQLRENDYVFGNRKFGGNAQSITRKRWIHHTSFLWDFESRNMAYLKLPKKIPEYRSSRGHMEFICRLKDYMTRSVFIGETVKAVGNRFAVKPVDLDVDAVVDDEGFVHSTRLLEKQELEEALAFEHSPLRILSQ